VRRVKDKKCNGGCEYDQSTLYICMCGNVTMRPLTLYT
jgi:hypothetical protein